MADSRLFAEHNHPDATEDCPRCGAALQLKHVGQQSFWGCSAYPRCHYTKPLHQPNEFPPEPLPDQFCPDCGEPLLLKKGRYGFFVGCAGFPACHYVADPTAPGPGQTPGQVACPACREGQLKRRTSRHGKSFYACDNYPKCRYLVNDEPVAQTCPDCQHGILVCRKTTLGLVYRCPQRDCDYQQHIE